MSKLILNKDNYNFIDYSTDGKIYSPSLPVQKVTKLPAGVYNIFRTQSGDLIASSMSVTSDELIKLPNFITQKVIDELDMFWKPETRKRYERRGMVYKRGIILHGHHGTGKSSITIRLMEEQVKAGNVVFFCPAPSVLSEFVKIMRSIEGDRPILVVLEEFEKLIYNDETGFLSLLDGEMQIDNVVYIATTNHLHKIPDRIKARPSRFATLIEVGLPNAETRKLYIESKTFPDEQVDLQKWVKMTEGCTIDNIKDLIINVFCIGLTLEEALKRTDSRRIKHTDEDDFDSLFSNENDLYKEDWIEDKKREMISKYLNMFNKIGR